MSGTKQAGRPSRWPRDRYGAEDEATFWDDDDDVEFRLRAKLHKRQQRRRDARRWDHWQQDT